MDNPIQENKYYGDVGYLYPHDIRYDASDIAFCNPLPDGSVHFRLITEHSFVEAFLVYNDGAPHGAPLHVYARDSRFLYWETVLSFLSPQISYSFALKREDGKIIYHCRHGVDHAVEPLDRWTLDLAQAQPFQPPEWVQGAVLYQIFPDRFANGDPGNDPPHTVPWGTPPSWLEFQGGDLDGIVARMDYLEDLGVDVLYLNPINVSPSTHKFDAVDFLHVDPAFGGDAALHRLVKALHRRNMRIIVDASFNHCHPGFFAFQDVIAHGPASPYWDWFTIYEHPIRCDYRPHLLEQHEMRPQIKEWLEQLIASTGIVLQAVDGPGPLFSPSYLAWYGVLDMPKLDQQNPDARAYFVDVAAHWLREFDIDGWRMDVARHIVPDFWEDFRRVCKATKPDCYLLSEIWGNTSPWLQGTQFDGTMNYIFRDLCVDYFATATVDAQSFLDGITRMLSLYAPQVTHACQNLLSSHDVERFRTLAGKEAHHQHLATLFQLTMPGAPGIYYGDEIGLAGGHDPDCRRAFPWQTPEDWDTDLLEMIRALNQLRRAHTALRLGTWRLLWAEGESFCFERAYAGEQILVLINRREAPPSLVLDIEAREVRVLWGQGQAAVLDSTLTISNPAPWSGLVLLCL